MLKIIFIDDSKLVLKTIESVLSESIGNFDIKF